MQQNLYEVRQLHDLTAGQIIYEDLYVGKRRLLSKGTILTNRLITLLHNRNVQQVVIKRTTAQLIQDQMRQEYLYVLGQLNVEARYGKILHCSDDVQLISTLYTKILENPIVYKLLTDLKNHDETTYLHAIDVYTIGTLFAISEGLIHVEDIGLGFLLHDIGKLCTATGLLNKLEQLTKNEYAVIQHHAKQGYDILCQHKLAHVAHYAKSHHERIDGTGYPEGLQQQDLSIELQMLQIIDVYSALTMSRPYHSGNTAVVAIEKLYKEVQNFNEELLHRFMNFIGIYPENAIVLLTDGNQALIEQTNPLYPLFPTVKIFSTGTRLALPQDFQIAIEKFITLHIDPPQHLFSKFSDALINKDFAQMQRYYQKLKDHYAPHQWISHIYLPMLNVFRVIENNKMVSDARLSEGKATLLSLLEDSLKLFRKTEQHKKKFILLLGDIKNNTMLKMFEGLLHSNAIYPFISSTNQSTEEIEQLITLCNTEGLIVIDEHELHVPSLTIPLYHLTASQLENFVFSYVSTVSEQQQFIEDLSRYNKKEPLLFTQ